jgi:3-isopropylmalate dehydrogenase
VKPGILEKDILLRTRFELDQYINLRPVKLYEGVETPHKDKGPKER